MKPERTIPCPCRGCGARLGWVYSTNRPKPFPNVPVDWDTLHAAEQIALKDGARVEFRKGHVSHFTTCSKVEMFSKSKKGGRSNDRKAESGSLVFE